MHGHIIISSGEFFKDLHTQISSGFWCILNNVSKLFTHSNLAISKFITIVLFTYPDINSSVSEQCFRTHWVIHYCTDDIARSTCVLYLHNTG